jgi:hypothetical protein
MIDFVKIKVIEPDIEKIHALPFLKWNSITTTNEGQIKEERAEYNRLTMRIKYNRYAYIEGSLHYYWNITHTQGDQNYNDFTFPSLAWTIGDICTKFNLNAFNCKIENIEFGVNMIAPYPISEILDSLILHKRKSFNRIKRPERYSCHCEHSQYVIKFYDKGIKFDIPNILRFEDRAIKMERLNIKKKIGIYTLNDLLNKDKLLKLGELLAEDFNDLLFYDSTIQETDLTASEYTNLTNGKNPLYWERLTKENPNYFPKKIERFLELVNRYGKQKIQETILSLVSQKWNELLNTYPETVQFLTKGLKREITEFDHLGIKSIPVLYTQEEELPTINTPERFCLSCGRDISDQKDGSKFCSAKFVGEEQSHKCRNADSNPRNSIKNKIERDIERGLLFLFDTVPYAIGGKRQSLR